MEIYIESLIKNACDFQAMSDEAREIAREKFRRKETEVENTIRISIDGLITSLIKETENKIDIVDKKISFKLTLISSYIRTHFIINDFLLNGDLVEASVLMRKQLETIVRLNELDSKSLEKLLGKTPNVGNILKGESGKIYELLSGIAHSSSHRIGELLSVVEDGEKVGVSNIPTYSEHAHSGWDLNTFISFYFLFHLLECVENWYPEKDFSEYSNLLFSTFAIAVKNGTINIPEKKKK
ncbi:hypothetical protein SAMN06313486_10438 [Epsilonproteobacteria bacterium SCGC AD-308-P11]|jgi:hypothetical protein|nr:hypothetical protein SAMN06313486_10438 [Epsilonproteobacteria bacterium SCGC AD-308-P11]